MTTASASVTDRELAAKHRAMWATGDYPKLAAELVAPLGPVLVEAAGIGPGDRVLDVAAGTGNAAIPAALAGAEVVASDLTPELLEHGKTIADRRGVDLQWREANAEALPFADNEFDTVMSCIGVMFAPHHQAGGRRVGAGVPAWRHDRPDQLDTGGPHRSALRGDEAARSAATAGCAVAAAVG